MPAEAASDRWIVVSVHDVAPGSEAASRRWLELLGARGLRSSLLVVPGPWRGRRLTADDDFSRWLREAAEAGHEIVQHGWEHREVAGPGHLLRRGFGRLAARGCAEFWTIDRPEAARRLDAGLAALDAAGLRPDGFVAPGWLLGCDAKAAVRAAGFRYTATHRGVLDLLTGRALAVPALSQRPASAVTAAAAHLTTRWARRAINHQQPLRVAAHPADLADRRTRQAVLGACEAARDAGYRSTTYGGLLGLGRAR
jgi:predicted deacetylase